MVLTCVCDRLQSCSTGRMSWRKRAIAHNQVWLLRRVYYGDRFKLHVHDVNNQ